MATAPNIASFMGEDLDDLHSCTSVPSSWARSPSPPTGAGPATQLHLLSLERTRPIGLAPRGHDTAKRPNRRGLSSADAKAIPLPAQIGPFQLGRPLARGGMSEVVEAFDVDRRRMVALKVMRPSGSGRRAEREAWDREIAILRAMKHPGVVPLLDYGIGEGGELYLAMPLLEGRSARGELVSMRLAGNAALSATTYDVLLPAFLDICDTLSYVHGSGVLHCDLKPGNIFIPRGPASNREAPNTRGLLLDWGVSVLRVLGRPRSEGGRPGGTPGYMAPEQITGRVAELDARTDVYGLGCLLYEFVSWRPVIRRGDPRRALRDALRGNLVPPEQRQSDVPVPTELSAICMKALASRPEDRYESAAEMAATLRTLLGV